jgi:hypothetical protein
MSDSQPSIKAPDLAKDAGLRELGDVANVAQFVSFAPGADPRQRFALLQRYEPDHQFDTLEEAVSAVFHSAPERSVNVRSFGPDQMKSNDFLYGLTTVDQATGAVRQMASNGLFTIVNETVDVGDGGVSGVAYAGLLEFAPGDTPRSVEKPGTLSIRKDWGIRLLDTVYGFTPDLKYPHDLRVEFSIHPIRRGYRRSHTIVWEMEQAATLQLEDELRWPNRFSRMLGDKAFGLLVADFANFPVPRTTVISRALPPFSFGRPTGTNEPWIRTCPPEPVPGLFLTQHGWVDPYRLLAEEDPEGTAVASVLSQESVEPMWSGALATGPDFRLVIEGVSGRGDDFMQGERAPERLPDVVVDSLTELHESALARLGPVRIEWVHDGSVPWVVQLHRGPSQSSGRVIYPGKARKFHSFEVKGGISELRKLIARLTGTGDGVRLVGDVGVTSHMGDLLRQARIPSRIESN